MGIEFPHDVQTLQTAASGLGYLLVSLLGGVGGAVAERKRRKREGDTLPDDVPGALTALRADIDKLRSDLEALRATVQALPEQVQGAIQRAEAAANQRDVQLSAAIEEVLKHADEARTQIAYLRGRFDERRSSSDS